MGNNDDQARIKTRICFLGKRLSIETHGVFCVTSSFYRKRDFKQTKFDAVDFYTRFGTQFTTEIRYQSRFYDLLYETNCKFQSK